MIRYASANNFFKYGDGEYHNYVFTMDAAGRARIFLDGQLVAQAKKSCTAAKFNGNRVMHLIGGSVQSWRPLSLFNLCATAGKKTLVSVVCLLAAEPLP